MKTRLEEIDELIEKNIADTQWALATTNPNMWQLIEERVKLEIEKHEILKKGN